MYIIEVIKAIIAGMVLGAMFVLLKLPVPAPTAFIGVLGVFSVWLGYAIATRLWG